MPLAMTRFLSPLVFESGYDRSQAPRAVELAWILEISSSALFPNTLLIQLYI